MRNDDVERVAVVNVNRLAVRVQPIERKQRGVVLVGCFQPFNVVVHDTNCYKYANGKGFKWFQLITLYHDGTKT